MIKSTYYPHQERKPVPTKKQQLQHHISQLIVENFGEFEDFTEAEPVWLAMKAKNIEFSVSTFYTRLRELVQANLIEKKKNGYNKYVYKKIA